MRTRSPYTSHTHVHVSLQLRRHNTAGGHPACSLAGLLSGVGAASGISTGECSAVHQSDASVPQAAAGQAMLLMVLERSKGVRATCFAHRSSPISILTGPALSQFLLQTDQRPTWSIISGCCISVLTAPLSTAYMSLSMTAPAHMPLAQSLTDSLSNQDTTNRPHLVNYQWLLCQCSFCAVEHHIHRLLV